MLLLDTCALLWLASDRAKLSAVALDAIRKNGDALFVSSITAFEIAVKNRSGKLELPLPPGEWYEEALRFHGIREMPVDGEIAVASVLLPRKHNDPCDRIIIATGALQGMGIVTSDQLIGAYDEVHVVW